MTQFVVEAEALTKTFGAITALNRLDLRIPQGEIFGVIGPNGAGKSTLMRILLDILRPTSGRVRVLGQDPVAGGAALRSRIGYLPGELRTAGRMTGRQLVNFWASIGPEPKAARAYADELAEQYGVDLARPAGKLSKGNKQKLGLIQAFMNKPEFLILDEPTSGLDPLIQQRFLQHVRDANRDGATVFLSSHILSEVEQVADSAAILRAGAVVREATVQELRSTAERHLSAVVVNDAQTVTDELARMNLDLQVSDMREGRVRLRGLVAGRSNDVVQLLAQMQVEDLVYSEPDLEESVLEIYADANATAAAGSDDATAQPDEAAAVQDDQAARAQGEDDQR